MADIFEISGRIHSTSQEHVTSPADEILDTSQNKKQHLINADVARHESEINSPTNGLNKRVADIEALGQIGDTPVETNASNIIDNTSLNGKVPSASAVNGVYNAVVTNAGYYTCDSEASTAAKVVDASGYVLTVGGCIKIKMTNANTADDDATLNINSTGAKTLYYAGERASATNSWEEGETVEVYYDGTNFYANNVAGSSGSGDGAFDVSAKYPTSGVEGGNTYTLEGAIAVLNANLSARNKKGGMSIKFIQASDHKYVQYRYMSTSTSNADFANVANWQGVDDEPTEDSKNIPESGGVVSYTKRNFARQEENAVEIDLDISDENDGVIARFSDGHVKTKKFDSSHIIANDIDNNTISTNKLQDSAVTTVKLQDEAVTNDKILGGTIEDTKLKNEHPLSNSEGACDLDICDENDNVIARFNGGHIKTKNFDSSNINAQSVDDNTITSSKIQSNAVTNDKLQANAVTNDKLQANSVTNEKILNGTIEDNKLKETYSIVSAIHDDSDFEISDENGNVIMANKNGHVKTKNFDSSQCPKPVNADVLEGDFCISDDEKNIILQVKDGYPNTKNFKGNDISYSVLETENSLATDITLLSKNLDFSIGTKFKYSVSQNLDTGYEVVVVSNMDGDSFIGFRNPLVVTLGDYVLCGISAAYVNKGHGFYSDSQPADFICNIYNKNTMEFQQRYIFPWTNGIDDEFDIAVYVCFIKKDNVVYMHASRYKFVETWNGSTLVSRPLTDVYNTLYSSDDLVNWTYIGGWRQDYTDGSAIAVGGQKGYFNEKGNIVVPVWTNQKNGIGDLHCGYAEVSPLDGSLVKCNINPLVNYGNESCVYPDNEGNVVVNSRWKQWSRAIKVYRDGEWLPYYGDMLPAPKCQESWVKIGRVIYRIANNPDVIHTGGDEDASIAEDANRVNISLFASTFNGLNMQRLIQLDSRGGYNDIDIDGNAIYCGYESSGHFVYFTKVTVSRTNNIVLY